jgi:hypothetical protein
MKGVGDLLLKPASKTESTQKSIGWW